MRLILLAVVVVLAATSQASAAGVQRAARRVVEGSVTVDLPSIATDACTDTSVTVYGAVAGRPCVVGPPPGLSSQVISICHVESDNTVHMHVCNLAALAFDPPSAKWYVIVYP